MRLHKLDVSFSDTCVSYLVGLKKPGYNTTRLGKAGGRVGWTNDSRLALIKKGFL